MEPLTSDDPVEVAGYRLRARLGSGGMGRVYLAFTPAGRAVALKAVRPDLGDDVDFRRRFRQEADAARRVHGVYTAQVLDADPDAVPPWLVTAYVPGPSLHEAVTASPSPRRPKPTPALDPCLVGTWTDVADDLLNTIDSHPVQFTGHGGYLIVRADGGGFEAFGPETMSATYNGNKWTDVFQGSVTMHVDTSGGSILYSDVVPSKNATQTLYENGAFNNSDPTTLEPGPERYTCSGSTLRTFDDVGSSVFVRKLPAAHKATAPTGS